MMISEKIENTDSSPVAGGSKNSRPDEKRIRVSIKYAMIPEPDEVYFWMTEKEEAYALWLKRIGQRNVRWVNVDIVEVNVVESIEEEFFKRAGLR